MRQRMTEARALGVTRPELAADADTDHEDPQGLLESPHTCHIALINYMGLTQLFEMLCQVCHPADPCDGDPWQVQASYRCTYLSKAPDTPAQYESPGHCRAVWRGRHQG